MNGSFGYYQTYHLTIHRRTLVLSSSLSSYFQKDLDLVKINLTHLGYDEIGTTTSEYPRLPMNIKRTLAMIITSSMFSFPVEIDIISKRKK